MGGNKKSQKRKEISSTSSLEESPGQHRETSGTRSGQRLEGYEGGMEKQLEQINSKLNDIVTAQGVTGSF